ncbi:paralemmin-1 isoform X1 [Dromiciops gliroides]|uniref:paralemmin-1 isoform X1 n=2 Tax=Dromiciops gliroides TaxID=33562 RepID=UPI001CC6204A|nr:paralemmin-1 isoform X1 [Dromiciops gliroides]
MEVSVETTFQQERLQAIAEKRKRQTEIENKRRQLEDDRRQLQHLKSKALRERWLLEGAPSTDSQEDEVMKKQMQDDEQKVKQLEDSILRLETELEILETGDSVPATRENVVVPAQAPAPSPVKEERKEEKILNSQKTPVASPREKKVTSSPMKMVEGTEMMKAAMYSVEITVEKDRVTGETKVLSSTTLPPQEPFLQGVKVYEDEMKVVHAVDATAENGIHQLSSSEVDELIHKADEVTLSEVTVTAAPEARGTPEVARSTPRREITGVQAQPGEASGTEASQEQPVTMIFMGYQNVEDEAETKKVLGLQDTIKAELVVIEDPAPPNGSAQEPSATAATTAPDTKEENQLGEKAGLQTPPLDVTASADKDLDMKKQRCRCCSVM